MCAKMGELLAPLDAFLLRDQTDESAERNITCVCMSVLRLFACITRVSTRWSRCAPRGGSHNALKKPSAFTCACERSMRRASGLCACVRGAAVLPCRPCTRLPPARHALASGSAAKVRDAPGAKRLQPAPPRLAAAFMSKARHRAIAADGAESSINLTPSGRSAHLAHLAATPDLRRCAPPAGVATLDADVKQCSRAVCTRMRRAARSCSVQQSLAVRRHMRRCGRRTLLASAE